MILRQQPHTCSENVAQPICRDCRRSCALRCRSDEPQLAACRRSTHLQGIVQSSCACASNFSCSPSDRFLNSAISAILPASSAFQVQAQKQRRCMRCSYARLKRPARTATTKPALHIFSASRRVDFRTSRVSPFTLETHSSRAGRQLRVCHELARFGTELTPGPRIAPIAVSSGP